MKIPDSILVFGVEYKVIFKRSIIVDGSPCDGLCQTSKKEIWINQYVPKNEKFQVFLHEVFHAALWEQGTSRELPDSLEETICDGLSKFLVNTYKFRKNNGKKD